MSAHVQAFCAPNRDCFGTFGSAKPRPSSKLRPKKFSQTWAFNAGTTVGRISRRVFSVLTGKKHKLWALMSEHYTERELVRAR